MKKKNIFNTNFFIIGLILILQFISLICIVLECKKNVLYINNLNDDFGNVMYPKSVYNSLLGYTDNSYLNQCYIISLLIFSKIIYANIIKKQTNLIVKRYVQLFVLFLFINAFVLVSNVFFTFCVFPAAKPEISSFEFPMAYADQYGSSLYYNYPIIHIIISIIVKTFLLSAITIFPIIIYSMNLKVAKFVNIILAILEILWFVLSLISEKIHFYDFLIPYNNDYHSLVQIFIITCLIILINIIYFIFYKKHFFLSFNLNLSKGNNVHTKLCVTVMISLLLIVRIVYINYVFLDQKINEISKNDKFESNSMSFSIQDTNIKNGNNLYQEYNLKMSKKQKAKTVYVLLVDLSLSNNYNSKVYFDFSNCYIMIGQWFTNLDLDLFNSINPQMMGNYRLCLKPGSELNVIVPFEISYNQYDSNDYLSKIIKRKKFISFFVGKYPVKNKYDIDLNSLMQKVTENN